MVLLATRALARVTAICGIFKRVPITMQENSLPPPSSLLLLVFNTLSFSLFFSNPVLNPLPFVRSLFILSSLLCPSLPLTLTLLLLLPSSLPQTGSKTSFLFKFTEPDHNHVFPVSTILAGVDRGEVRTLTLGESCATCQDKNCEGFSYNFR